MTINNAHEFARELKAEGLGWDAILDRLKQKGIEASEAENALEALKKEFRTKNRNIGMTLLLLGSFICAFSMGYTYFFGHSVFMLYGLTMLGVGIAFVGLVYVMG
jgi:hypothetical protein